MKIRRGTAQEAVELALKLPDFANPYNLRSLDTPLPTLDHVLVAESDGMLVAFRAGRRFSNDTFAVWLAGVLPEHRGHGIASKLYRVQKDWLKSQGYRFIRTHVRNSNRRMLQILVNANYCIADIVRYGDIRRNKIIFVKDLWAGDARMSNGTLIVGLLNKRDPNPANEDVCYKLRDLTISWLRFKYSGRIIEDSSVDAILAQASEAGHRYCLILATGNIVTHAWNLGLLKALEEWADTHQFLVAGEVLVEKSSAWGISDRCALVSMQDYQRLGRPKFDVALPTDTAVLSLPEPIASTVLDITPACDREARAFRRILGEGIATACLNEEDFSHGQRRFLVSVQRQVQNCQRGVFVWNFESYDDVNTPPSDFASPLDTLYSVAAGLKSNWILQTHGFNESTTLVYVDYSEQALRFKQLLHEEWDGEDYPAFLRYLLSRLQPGETFYQLWGGFSPEDMDWKTVETAWALEIARWGGRDVLKDHWRRAKTLSVRYVLANLLEEHDVWLKPERAGETSVIWWSNVFSTFYSNWFHSIAERRVIYEKFIRQLLNRTPRIVIYGYDYHNILIAGVRACEYSRSYFMDGDQLLEPRCWTRSTCHSDRSS